MISMLYEWQTLVGGIIGGLIALIAAWIVAHRSERRDDLAAAMHVVGTLVEIVVAGKQLERMAQEDEELKDPNNRAFWQAEKLAHLRPRISSLFELHMARILPIDVAAAAHLKFFHSRYLYMEEKIEGVEAAMLGHQSGQEPCRKVEYVRADAIAVKGAFDDAVLHADCAEHLISRHILSKWAMFNRLRSRWFPDAKTQFCHDTLRAASNNKMEPTR